MAIGDYLPIVAPSSVTSTLSPSSSSAITRRKSLIQVATHNSATFISFPANVHRATLYIPKCRPRTSRSIIRPVSLSIDTESTSSKSKSSNTPSSSIGSARLERHHSERRPNPILNNSLLNHRKQQPNFHPVNISADFSSTKRLCLSAGPLKTASDDNQTLMIHTNRTPFIVTQKSQSDISDKQVIEEDDDDDDEEDGDSDDDEESAYGQAIYGLNKTKYDYITNWLYDVEQAVSSTETFSSKKYSKKKLIQS